MYTPDDRTEELLNGYLDGYLSTLEEQEIKTLLASDRLLSQHFESMKGLRSELRQMLRSPENRQSNQPPVGRRRSNADLFQNIISEARQRVATDPVHASATWVLPKPTMDAVIKPVRLQNSEHKWTWVMAGLAASLVVAAGWLVQSRFQGNAEIGKQGLIAQIESSLDPRAEESGNETVAGTAPSSTIASVESQAPKLESLAVNPAGKRDTGLVDSATASTVGTATQAAEKSPSNMSSVPATIARSEPIAPAQNSNTSGNSFVKPNTQPTAEQVAALENALKGSVSLSYLLVVDISLRDNEESREILDQILTRYDIPSAVDLNVEESTLKKLADSRLIASGKAVLPDAKPKVTSTEPGDDERAGLMFVKARGERLDAAIIEIMQQVDAFPEFSMDMAFDAPAQALASELQFIQEAALPKNAPIAKSSIASMLSSRSRSEDSANRFQAPQRRGLPLAPEKRINGKGPNGLGAEMMNPISCAILILREAK
jgi:hypothetical protein